MVRPTRVLRDCSGSGAAEFALVLPLLLILMFGILDVGRFMWTVNTIDKAVQAGARYAVVTDPIVPALGTSDFVGVGGLTQGDRIPASAMATITCTGTATTATCTGCSGAITSCSANAVSFNNIVARMQYYDSDIAPENVIVEYRGSGIGYAGDPLNSTNWTNHPQIQPLVTVKVQGLTFDLVMALTLIHFDLPSFSTTLTAEDLSGSGSA
jgi:Flp pilus assembly protein TadG